MKKQFKLVCECKKEIIGFSESHINKNLEFHKLSKEHKERMEVLKEHQDAVFIYDLKDDELSDFLSKNPVIIEDIRAIGG